MRCFVKEITTPIYINIFYTGDHGGQVVESLTLAREVVVRYLPPPWCVLYEQRQIYSLKISVYTQESVALSRPD